MADHNPLKVLFLGRQNAARSPMAECLLNAIGAGRYSAFSAGIEPAGAVHPCAIELLSKNKLPVDKLRSKDWRRFAAPGLLELDFVISLCDLAPEAINAAWPGDPILAHWAHPDPCAESGDEADARRAFFNAYNQLYRRLTIFASLPMAKLDRAVLKSRIDEIGRKDG